jgi:lysyl endopeptidase
MHKILLFILLALTANCFGQLSQGGYPFDLISLKSVSLQKKVVKMPSFNLKADQAEDMQLDNLKSLKFAHSFPVSITPQNDGIWYYIDGYKVWQLTIQSEGAYSLNIIFAKFYIPDGARLFVFDKEKNVILGAFTNKNNKPYKKLAIYPLPGDELIVQYEEPVNPEFNGELEIGEINHDYKGIFSMNNRFPRRHSEDCNIDVNCETGSGLENEKRAVCRVIAKGELGVGNLVNNTQQNGKPYLISAFHVYDKDNTVDVSEIAQETIYDFNYESPFCSGLNGYDVQSISGSTALASFDSLDLMSMKYPRRFIVPTLPDGMPILPNLLIAMQFTIQTVMSKKSVMIQVFVIVQVI